MFRNRNAAAAALARRLEAYRGTHPLVLGIPRGAVPMAEVIASALGGEVDVVLVRKLGAPGNPEFAVGAIDESGHAYVAPHAAAAGADHDYLAREKKAQLQVLRARRALYTPARPPRDPADRVVIVVDDGLATGATMTAALRAVRARGPRRLVCAVPVASAEAAGQVSRLADEVVCLATPEWLGAISQFYDEFPQVADEEVVEILRRGERTARPEGTAQSPA